MIAHPFVSVTCFLERLSNCLAPECTSHTRLLAFCCTLHVRSQLVTKMNQLRTVMPIRCRGLIAKLTVGRRLSSMLDCRSIQRAVSQAFCGTQPALIRLDLSRKGSVNVTDPYYEEKACRMFLSPSTSLPCPI